MLTTSNADTRECPICHGVGFFRRDVPVDHPDFGKPIPCPHKLTEMAQARLEDLRQASGLALLAHTTFETFMPDGIGLTLERQKNLRRAFEIALAFAEQPRGWLLLKGGFGCGKTHLAAAIANERLKRGEPAAFVVVPDLLDHLRATFSPTSEVTYDDRFDEVRTTPLLILDDLGAQSTTEWAREKLFQIFNYRYNAQLPTVVTTNRELEELDLRLRSRFADPSLCMIVTILAPDFRQSGVDRFDSELSSLALHREMTFDAFDLRESELHGEERQLMRDAVKIAKTYAASPDGWLTFIGEYGCGKTHLAAAIANYRVQQGQPALFVVVPDLLDHLRATFSPNSAVSYDRRFDEVRTAPFLVLDDLGTQSATPWAQEKVYQIFNYRYTARLPTVITTTQELEQMDPRLRSRIEDVSRNTIIANFAPSYRGARKRTGARGTEKRGTRR
jgi:DNA replication protein DnaC